MGFFDMVGVASILPLLAVISNPAIVQENQYLKQIYEFIGLTDTHRFIVFLSVGSFFFLVFSQSFKSVTMYALTKFSRMRGFSISALLMSHYLRQPYVWFLGRHSAELGKSVISQIDGLVTGVINPAVRLMASVSVAAFLIVALLIVNPVAALAGMLIVGGSYFVLFAFSRLYLLRIGKKRVHANEQRFRSVQETFGVIKEIKLNGSENNYIENFRGPARHFARVETNAMLLQQVPRFILELIVFGSMLFFIVILLVTMEGRVEHVLPTLGVFAFAGVRMFPALQMIYRSLSSMRFNQPSLTAIYEDIRDIRDDGDADAEPLGLRERLEFKDVHFTYPGAERPALAGLDVTVEACTTVGIVGSTGAGKTTAVDLLLGLLEPEAGELRVDGMPIDGRNRRGWQRSLGYVPQHIFLLDDTIAANIALGVRKPDIDMAKVERAARVAGLHDFVVSELPDGYLTTVGERGVRFSGGQRQRIGIARALYHDPAVLVLDEATSALDNVTEKAVIDAVHDLVHAKTVIMIAHRLTTVERCDKIIMLERGRCVAEGPYRMLIEESRSFRELAAAAG